MSNTTRRTGPTLPIQQPSKSATSSADPSSTDWRSLSYDELAEELDALGAERYRTEQIFGWMHGRGVESFDAMTNVPGELRQRLASTGHLETLAEDVVQQATDGTRKFRFRLRDRSVIESVLIPDGDKLTLCVSSQAGCALDCRFCATATIGFGRQLTTGEIVDQIWRVRSTLSEGRRITNLVFMGMGEPLHNYKHLVRALGTVMDPRGGSISPRRITVSTAGLVSGIDRYAEEPKRAKLAISLNATTDEVRDHVMPINKKWNLTQLLDAVRRFPLERGRRVTFEYVLLAGVNDSLEDARRLPKLLRGIPCKVNLIPFNPFPGVEFKRPSPAAIELFQNAVKDSGLPAYLRTPRGDDIDAACGQLAAGPDREG